VATAISRPDFLGVYRQLKKGLFEKSTLIFGCGNILWGDDGFGPAVIQHLNQNYELPEDVLALDMGTSIRDTLFDLSLSDRKPGRLMIVDAVDFPDREPGEVFEIPVSHIPQKKVSDFSLHQFPTTNLLAQLKENTKIEIVVLVAQIENIPDEVSPGLSKTVQGAVIPACERIVQILKRVDA
jgi:coenzyme F420 hydrogenase subunit delta